MASKAHNRRYDDYVYDDEMSGMNMVRRMGMPFMYIVGTLCGVTGMICMGIITYYWAHLDPPTCFLYSKSASNVLGYTFGSSLSNCYWITYGPIPAIILYIICGFLYWFAVVQTRGTSRPFYSVLIGMILATLILLAVSCTLAEGMRITCTDMGKTQANNRGVTCNENLDIRVKQFNLPIKTSLMVNVTSGCLWTATILGFILCSFHILSFNKRSQQRQPQYPDQRGY